MSKTQIVTDDRIQTLPVWARTHIYNLQRQVEHLEETFKTISGDETNLRVRLYWDRPSFDKGCIFLPDDAVIEFLTENGPISVCYYNDVNRHINIRTTNGVLSVMPYSSNWIIAGAVTYNESIG